MSEDKEGVSQTWMSRILNILICRGDLADEKLEAAPVSIKELFRYSTLRDRIYVAIGLVLAIILGILQPTTCVVSGYIANLYIKNQIQIGNEEMWSSAMWLCLLSGIVGFFILIFGYVQSYVLSIACTRIVGCIRKEFVKAVLRQNAAWFDMNSAGTISNQLNNNIERIQDGMGDKIGLILRGCSSFLTSVVLSLIINWRTTVVSIGIGPMGAITMGLMARFTASSLRAMLSASGEASALAEESIMNVKTVAACNGQQFMIQKYVESLKKGLRHSIKVNFLNGFFEGCMFFQLYAFFAAGILYGTISYYEGAISEPGSILASANAILLGGYFLAVLGPHMMSLLKARVAAAVIYKTIDREVGESRNVGNVTVSKGRIRFDNVHFQYPNRETPILTGCSWLVEAGQTIAFVGHSGCGKSTSIGLLTKLYEYVKGSIQIDDIEIKSFDTKTLREQMGIVEQEPCLFNGTIEENILLGRNISTQQMENATKISNAHEFIMKLPMGYKTLLGAGGMALSGGQKQRIAIARAIVTNPKILLLDEATSALDTESERVVQAALNEASRGRTTIVVAHRLSTLQHVNKIHVIDKGKVVAIGSHSELVEKNSIYASLARAQEMGIVEKRMESLSNASSTVKSVSPLILEKDSSSTSLTRAAVVNYGIRLNSSEDDFELENTEYNRDTSYWLSVPIFTFLSNSGGGWKVFLTILCCCFRGLELPAYAYLQIIPFKALQLDRDTYSRSMWEGVGAFLSLAVYIWIFLCLSIGLGGWASEELVNKLRVKFLSNVLHRDAAYFDEPHRSTAACTAALSLQAPNILACLDYRFILMCNNVVSLIVCLLLTFFSCWPTGLVSLILLVVFTSLLITFTKLSVAYMQIKSKKDRTAEFAVEVFERARTIQLLSVEGYFCSKYEEKQEEAELLDVKLTQLQSASFALSSSFIYISDLFCYSTGAYMIYYGHFAASTAFVAALCANFSGWSIVFASPAFNDLAKANSAIKTLSKFMDSGPPIVSIDDGKSMEIEGSLKVEKVSFSYPTRPNEMVARNLTLHAGKGESIALVGASGCGKSTLIQLIERFYTTGRGTIKIDSTNIYELSLKCLRNQIALVGQEPILFRGSIFENICLGCENVTLEDVRKAAETASAARFIEAFPEGYDTDVGEKGKSLSGGQKQRIAIARAVVRNPKILLLDEATSALDTESEKNVQQALNRASSGRTSITIAHRLSTIRNSNRIYLIENGSIAECGTHDDLVQAKGKYSKLVSAQTLDERSESKK